MTNDNSFHDVTTIGKGQLVSIFQELGGPRATYQEQHDAYLASSAPAGNAEKYLQSLFARTRDHLDALVDADTRHANGTTAAVAHIDTNGIITTANLGDSRVMLYVQDGDQSAIRAFALTDDQIPTRPDEKARIEAAGGIVIQGRAVGRGTPGIAISRSYGDGQFGAIVSQDPEIKRFDLSSKEFGIGPGDSVYVAVETDGAHKNMTPDQRANALARALQPDTSLAQIPARLSDIALEQGSRDNISIVLARLEPGRESPMMLGVFDGHGKNGRIVSHAVSDIMADLAQQDLEVSLEDTNEFTVPPANEDKKDTPPDQKRPGIMGLLF